MMDRWLPKIILAGAILILLLTSLLIPQLKAANPQEKDILVQVLGGTADFAAAQAYQEAEIYYHAGFKCDCPDEEEHENEHRTSNVEHRTSNGEKSANHSSLITHHAVRLPLLSMVKRLHGETAPRVHKHLVGEEEKELLPWFIAAVRLNPHFIDAWRTGSYWFYRTDNGNRGVDFINDGIRHNPGDYRLYLDRGILYHRLKEWQNAIHDLETARRLWKNDSEDSPYELRAIHTYLGDCRAHQRVMSDE